MTEPSSSPSSLSRFLQSLPLNTGSQCIRVFQLEVLNPNEVNGGVLRGDLRIIDLAAAPIRGFTALSYVCGNIDDANPSSIILLGPDCLSLQLTSNCHEALKNLRLLVRPLTIWVDAISIHQYDVGEKNHQIPLMGEIDSRADTTFIWLGPADEAYVRAVKRLSSVGLLNYFFSSTEQGLGASVRPRTVSAAFALHFGRQNIQYRYLPYFEPSVHDLIRFLDSQYLYRLWTYQEVMLSQNAVLVRGQLTIPWWRFAMSTVYLSDELQWPSITSGETESRQLLWLWKVLALDRNNLEFGFSSSGPSHPPTYEARNLMVYRHFLNEVIEISFDLEILFLSEFIITAIIGIIMNPWNEKYWSIFITDLAFWILSVIEILWL